MSAREEIKMLMEQSDARNAALSAAQVVEAAKDANLYPHLNKHLWQVPETDLAAEARLARAHRLLIAIRVVTGDGVTTRMFMHTRGVPGYQSSDKIAKSPDLAREKLAQLTDAIGQARARLRAFRAILPDDVGDEIDAALATAEARALDATAERGQAAA